MTGAVASVEVKNSESQMFMSATSMNHLPYDWRCSKRIEENNDLADVHECKTP
jgi:hypothetical protein